MAQAVCLMECGNTCSFLLPLSLSLSVSVPHSKSYWSHEQYRIYNGNILLLITWLLSQCGCHAVYWLCNQTRTTQIARKTCLKVTIRQAKCVHDNMINVVVVIVFVRSIVRKSELCHRVLRFMCNVPLARMTRCVSLICFLEWYAIAQSFDLTDYSLW